MNSRRNFIKNTGMLALAGAVSRKGFAAMLADKKMHAAGLQLFTLFNTIDKDVKGTLDKIAAIVYKELESAFSMLGGYYGKSAKEFGAMAKASGLAWQSHHTMGAPFKMPPGGFKPPAGSDTTKKAPPMKIPPMKNLKENHQEIVDGAAEGGVKYLICASIPLDNAGEINEAVDILGKSVAGMQHFFVEQDMAASPFESITTSFKYLSEKILK